MVTGNREQDTGNRIQGTGYREQVTGNRIQGTGYREQDTGKREQGTRFKKQRSFMEEAKRYKQLVMWQVAHELTLAVYTLTRKFPKEERFGLVSQLRRAAVSVGLNIIEGFARGNTGDLSRFLDIAFGSLSEVEYLLELSHSLGYMNQGEYDDIEKMRARCGKLLWSYRKKVKASRK